MMNGSCQPLLPVSVGSSLKARRPDLIFQQAQLAPLLLQLPAQLRDLCLGRSRRWPSRHDGRATQMAEKRCPRPLNEGAPGATSRTDCTTHGLMTRPCPAGKSGGAKCATSLCKCPVSPTWPNKRTQSLGTSLSRLKQRLRCIFSHLHPFPMSHSFSPQHSTSAEHSSVMQCRIHTDKCLDSEHCKRLLQETTSCALKPNSVQNALQGYSRFAQPAGIASFNPSQIGSPSHEFATERPPSTTRADPRDYGGERWYV